MEEFHNNLDNWIIHCWMHESLEVLWICMARRSLLMFYKGSKQLNFQSDDEYDGEYDEIRFALYVRLKFIIRFL
jgi:hypothetical protein